MLIENQEREVICQDLFRMDNVIRVSSYLLHESRDLLDADKPRRGALICRLEILRVAALLHFKELELEIGKELASSFGIVCLGA